MSVEKFNGRDDRFAWSWPWRQAAEDRLASCKCSVGSWNGTTQAEEWGRAGTAQEEENGD